VFITRSLDLLILDISLPANFTVQGGKLENDPNKQTRQIEGVLMSDEISDKERLE
jgi:hypothetical protein